jgi:hypothetical protein
MAAPSMNELANRYEASGIGSVFLYTNEAHPGENYPHHDSFHRKLTHARALRDRLGVNRPILVDGLDGACHQTFGTMPNMTWIIGRTGVPVYKSDWTDAASVSNELDYLLQVGKRRLGGARLAQFRVERLDYRDADRRAFFAGLERSGPKAVAEFEEFSRGAP